MASSKNTQAKNGNGGKVLDGARKQAMSPVDGQNSRKQQSSQSQPKAWQGGVNPITQRSSSSTPNGTEKPLPKLPSQSEKSNGSTNTQKDANDRLVFLLGNMTGSDVTLTLNSGEQFTGVFSGASLDNPSKAQYILKMTKRTRLPSQQQSNGTVDLPDEYSGEGENHTMSFDIQDTIHLEALNVTTTSASATPSRSNTPSFRTDAQISGRDYRERELQRWDGGPETDVDLSLDAKGSQGWDQFAANEKMYGVQSTYDENIYTTQIDRSNPAYRQREAQAAQIAREIERSAPSNAHVAEERIQNAAAGDDDGLDEEEKYSGVRRETALPKRAANAYVPPSQRTLTTAPTVQGAPFDPAIISLAKPTGSPKPSSGSATTGNTQNGSMPPIRIEAPKPEATEDSTKDASAAGGSKKTANPNVSDHVQDTVDAFKVFANQEKLRLKQAQDAKRSSARHEKNVKLNDLKKFAASFKLNSRVPDDLVPILAKDREKQLEIQRKADEAAKLGKTKEKDSASNATPSPPANTTSQTGPTSPADPRAQQNQQSRARGSQQMRVPPPSGPAQSPRAPQSQRPQQGQGNQQFRPQPLPSDLRIPTGPANPPADRTMSPSSATKLNVNAFEFRPAASNFTPGGATPSPQRPAAAAAAPAPAQAPASTTAPVPTPAAAPAAPVPAADTPSKLFKGEKPAEDARGQYNTIKYLVGVNAAEMAKIGTNKKEDDVDRIPKPFRTPPTWATEATTSYKDNFPKSQMPGQGPSPLHTPNPNGPMPHAHQLPNHMHGPPMMNQSRPYYAQHQQGHQPFNPGMQPFAPNGSVQNSPRFPNAQMAFNNQMPPQMQQYGGQPMQGYAMSPSMGYRQMQMPAGGPMQMMMPGQQQGQMQMRQGYQQGPGYGAPMGGHMMMHSGSQGGYMNGPAQQQPYSPMPPHAQPHMGQMQHGGPGGFNGNPRPPPMMQHQGSHQGYQPQMQMGQQQFTPGQHHAQSYPMQHGQRQLSSGGQFPQMTPRQQNAAPQHPSPGMPNAATAQGDEGK